MPVLVPPVLVGTGCRFLLDEADCLAADLVAGATRLKNSRHLEALIVKYEPPNDLEYAVRFTSSTSPDAPFNGMLVIGRERMGQTMESNTTDHSRFMCTPVPLYIGKKGEPVYVLLKNSGDRIDVVNLW
jgi:hypothetical protein